MKITKLPYSVEVGDYHEFSNMQDILGQLVRGIRVEEVMYIRGGYIGIVYHTSTSKAKLKVLKAKLEKTYGLDQLLNVH